MDEPDRKREERLEAEAVDQLHHLDDRRDAAELRVEELVRDAEYDDRPHGEQSRLDPRLALLCLAAGIAIGLGLLWLRSMCL